jgi:hypothetical protein
MPHPEFTIDRYPLDFEPADHDLGTATTWALHLEVSDHDSPEHLLEMIHGTGAEALAPFVCGGDSWEAWCEPATPDTGQALHVTFRADDLADAQHVARAICSRIAERYAVLLYLDPEHVTLSTAGDWAMQAEVWQ